MAISVAALLTAEALGLLILEIRRPLRRPREPKLHRDARNAAIAALALATTLALEAPLADRLSRFVARRRCGVVPRLPISRAGRTVLAIVLMDYTMYLWHALAHRTPWLWRFHVVHHADRGLDASTALRFHAGEQLLSVPWRAAQIVLIGVTPLQLAVWQTAFLGSIVFHHSDVRLPAWERTLRAFVVTPALHGIHHADRRTLQRHNLSSGLTAWDRLHGTYCDDASPPELVMGLPAYGSDGDVTLAGMLRLPFGPQRDAFRRPPAAAPDSEPAAAEDDR